jgi:Tfp pilus assembly protein PilV
MLNMNFTKRMKKNEAGFTFVELLIASAMSIIVLGLLAHVFRSQQKEFGSNNELNTMQANARGATEFITRSVQNSGFNVKRGTRFLSATDHSLTAVYDANNDDVIQNNEVVTYYLANAWNGTATESNIFTAWFDVDNDGTIDSTESRNMTVGMTVTGPPFNLYKVTPNAAGTGVERSLLARNIDNMVIKYYDNQGRLLPWRTDPNDTDADTTDDIFFNNITTDSPDLPDGGNWTFNMPVGELNNIRKVEVELIGRSRNKNPKENVSAGNYLPGSLAAVKSGSTAYSDLFYREEFTTRMAPRNLTQAPWGSVSLVASPVAVDCPNGSTITATMLDANGDALPSLPMNFTATGGTTVTVGSPSTTSDSNGEGTTTLTYDFSNPYFTSTISASGLVDDGSGNMKPIYNASPVSFSFGTQGGFVDSFNATQPVPWTDLVPGVNFYVPPGQEYFASEEPLGTITGSVNGCSSWQNYSVQTNLKQQLGGTWSPFHYTGLLLRHTDASNYYMVVLQRIGSTEELRIYKRVLGALTLVDSKVMVTIPGVVPGAFADDTNYTLKAQVSGTDIRVKLWQSDPTDPKASEPTAWETNWNINGVAPVTDTSLTVGNFGVITQTPTFQFDDISVSNPEPIT